MLPTNRANIDQPRGIMGIFQNNPKHKFLYERALQKTRKGDMDGAYADFTTLLDIVPDMADAYFKRGYIMLRKGDLKNAAPDFQQALRLEPNHSDAAMMRGMLKRFADMGKPRIGAPTGQTITLKDVDATPIPVELEVQDTETPQFYVMRGEERYENGQVEEAIDDFVDAIRLDSNCVNAYVNLGAIYHEYGEDELAQQYFYAALNLDPHHPDAQMMREIAGIAEV
ncbi:MAG: tetratricopeptide repeat protein [Anaerolineae bacterium]